MAGVFQNNVFQHNAFQTDWSVSLIYGTCHLLVSKAACYLVVSENPCHLVVGGGTALMEE